METADELLESIFVAMNTGHPVVALLQFAKLNESLCDGAPLPRNWEPPKPTARMGRGDEMVITIEHHDGPRSLVNIIVDEDGQLTIFTSGVVPYTVERIDHDWTEIQREMAELDRDGADE